MVRSLAVRPVIASITGMLLLAGCAAAPLGPTVQVMPGPGKSFDAFAAEQASCKGYASTQVQGQAEASNQRAAGAALLTTVLGAATGAAIGSTVGAAGSGAGVGAATGAGAGSAIGASSSSNDQVGIQTQYDNSYSQCMYAKGNNVPGFAPQTVAYDIPRAAAAVPDPMVRSTQAELGRLGYLHSGADGFMGPQTHRAISSFEAASGLPVDGAPSRMVLAKLQATPTRAAGPSTASSGWVSPNGATASATPASASGAPAASAGWVSPSP